MNPEDMQPNNPQHPPMTPDEAAASLAFATKLNEGMMPQGAEQLQSPAPQEAPANPTEPETPKEEVQKTEEPDHPLTKSDFDKFEGKIEGIIETKFNELMKSLKNEDNNKE